MNCENHEKNEIEKSWFVLFLFTFFAPTGLNYLYLGLKKRAIFFITTYFIAFVATITTLKLLGRVQVIGFSFFIAVMFIFIFATIFKIIIFKDTLNIAQNMSEGLLVKDTTEDLLNFLKNHKILIVTVILSIVIAIFTITMIAFNLRFTGMFPHTLRTLILVLMLLSSTAITFLGIAYLTARSWFEIDCIAVQTTQNQEAKPQNNSENIKETESVNHANIEAQIQEIADISNELLNFIERNPNIEQDSEKVVKLNNFLKSYIPSTSTLLSDYKKLKAQEDLQKQLMKSIGKEINTSVLMVKNQLDMLTKDDESTHLSREINRLNEIIEKEINTSVLMVKNQLDMLTKDDESTDLSREINRLNEALKREGLLED